MILASQVSQPSASSLVRWSARVIWAISGAILVAFDLLPWRDAMAAAAKGTDVYFFLIGMMLLAEVARKEGLFDWLAVHAVRHAQGSARRLFLIVYGVGIW